MNIKKETRDTENLPFVYKGYTATIEYSRQDNTFVGYVKGLIPIIEFSGKDIPELESEFHKKIDMYIDECEKEGKEPAKQYLGEIPVKISPEMYSCLVFICDAIGAEPEQILNAAVISGLCRYRDIFSELQEDGEVEENEYYDISKDYEEKVNRVTAMVNAFGKIFFYRDIAAEIMLCGGEDCWEGKLLNVQGEITFEAENLEKLYGEFIKTVDKYYEECQNKAIKPQVYHDGKMEFEIPPFIDYLLDLFAEMEDESVDTLLQYFTIVGVEAYLYALRENIEKADVFEQMLGIK